jgi:transposase-like protein
MMAARRWVGRRFSDEERLRAFQRILEGVAYVDVTSRQLDSGFLVSLAQA